MRIALLIIGLCLGAVTAMQSFTIFQRASLFSNQSLAEAGSMGLLIALIMMLGAAFALGVPRVSIGCFAVAAVLALAVGTTSSYSDMTLWGIASAGLTILAYFGHRERLGTSQTSPVADVDHSMAAPARGRSTGQQHAAMGSKAQASSPTREDTSVEQLERLAALRASGALSDAEFASMKSSLISHSAN